MCACNISKFIFIKFFVSTTSPFNFLITKFHHVGPNNLPIYTPHFHTQLLHTKVITTNYSPISWLLFFSVSSSSSCSLWETMLTVLPHPATTLAHGLARSGSTKGSGTSGALSTRGSTKAGSPFGLIEPQVPLFF